MTVRSTGMYNNHLTELVARYNNTIIEQSKQEFRIR